MPINNSVTHVGSIALAQSLLDRLGAVFEVSVTRAATLCARDESLDEHQWSSYELAMADADLRAARALVCASARAPERDTSLGLAFISEAIASVFARLQGIYIMMDLNSQPLNQLASGDELRRLRHDAAQPEVMARLANAVEGMEAAADAALAFRSDRRAAARRLHRKK